MQPSCPQVSMFHKYLQSLYQTKFMYPVTVMLFCIGVCQAEMDRKLYHCSLIQGTVSENITSKVHTCVICKYSYEENQLDAVQQYVYWQLQNCSTCFGRFLRPSSGALGTIVAACGVLHEKG